MDLKTKEKPAKMDFNEKYNQCIKAFTSIDDPKNLEKDINGYVDFLEIMTVFAGEDGVSYGDILDHFYGMQSDEQTAETNDRNETYVNRVFALFEERMLLFGESYPFLITEEKVVKLRENLSNSKKLYIFLLLSSSLNIFRPFQSELTADFEDVCFETMKSFLPNAIVKAFGEHSEYQGTAREKIKALADDIGLPIDTYEISQIGERNVQERGLDIVAWIPHKDNCTNLLVFLCQCGCGKNFESKQHDTRRFENYYLFYKTKPQHTLFIPYSLINPNERKFYHSDYVEKDYLIFERKRILGLLEEAGDAIFNNLKTKPLVEKCITN